MKSTADCLLHNIAALLQKVICAIDSVRFHGFKLNVGQWDSFLRNIIQEDESNVSRITFELISFLVLVADPEISGEGWSRGVSEKFLDFLLWQCYIWCFHKLLN